MKPQRESDSRGPELERQEARLLLGEYVRGTLDDSRAAAVQKHLAADAELRKLEHFLRWLQPRLRQMREHLPGQHPTGEELVSAALGSGDDSNQRADWVRDHLQACPECRQLMEMVTAADTQLEQEEARQDEQTPAATPAAGLPSDPGPDRTSPAPQWSKLAMAAVIAVVLITSGIWIGQRNSDPAPGSAQGPAIHLAGITRGQTGATDVSPSADGQLPLLALECDPWVGRTSADDFLLEIRLNSRETRQVIAIWHVNARSAWSAEEQGVVLRPDSPAPPPGDYDLDLLDDSGQIIFQTGFHLLPR